MKKGIKIGTRRATSVVTFMLILALGATLISNLWVIESTKSKLHCSLDDIPTNDIALVLGTTHKLKTGEENAFFSERIRTAADLYQVGKVKGFILSGDNRTRYYNEPSRMREALLSYDVPDSVITLDNSGFRTLDSIVRCNRVFGNSSFTIITQEFHAYRALFISDYHSLDVVALAAGNPPGLSSFKVIAREYIARPLAVLDLFILNKEPSLEIRD